jgi:hypothetical protein
VAGTFIPVVTNFLRSAMSFCGLMATKFGDILKLHFFCVVQSGVHLIVECSLLVKD